MANERYNVEIGLQFLPGQAASQVNAEIGRILREAQSASKSSGGILDLHTADQFGERLGQAIRKAVNQDIKGSSLYGLMRPKDQKALTSAALPAPTSQFLATQMRLVLAEQAREMVKARKDLAIGAEPRKVQLDSGGSYIAKGYADVATRDQAVRSAELRYTNAVNSATKAREKLVADIVKAGEAEVKAAQDAAAQRLRSGLAIAQADGKRVRAAEAAAAADQKASQSEVAARLRSVFAITQADATRRDAAKRQDTLDKATSRRKQEAEGRGITAIERRAESERIAEARTRLSMIRRFKADQLAAEKEEKRLRGVAGADEARSFPVSYPDAARQGNAKIASAQEAVNIAERRLSIADVRLAEVRISQTRTAEKELGAQNALDSATRALYSARQRLTQEEIRAAELLAKNSQGRLGVVGQFQQGFKGVSDRPFAEQIGQAFKFSLFYGTAYKALFALTQTFQQTLQEGIAFQQGVTELRLATGQSADAAKDLANQFGEEASKFGFAPSQGALIGARAQGYYGTTGASLDTQRQVGEVSARIVNQIAFASGKQPDDIQANLAAVAQAYGLGPQSQQMIGDLDAYFARKFGIQAGQTIGAIAQSGTVGRAAGFSPAEVSAIAADIMARTGATEQTTGGYLAQIFSRAGEGSLTSLAGRYGIDPNANLAEQFKSLAQVYAARPEDRDDISAAFGRGKVQNAVIALLQDYPRVQREAAAAGGGAAGGELQKATDLRLADIGGQIQQTVGALREFAKELGESGVLDMLGAGVVAFRELVEAGTDLLKMWNELNRGFRDGALVLAAFIAAVRLATGAEAVKAGGGYAGAVSNGLLARGGLSFFRSGGSVIPEGRLGVASASGTIAPVGSRAGAGAIARGGIAMAGGYGVLAAALADAYLIKATRDTSEKFNKAREGYIEFLSSHEEDLTTAEGQQALASSAKQSASDSEKAADGFLARFKNLGADKEAALSDAKRAEADSKLATSNAALIEAYNRNIDPETALISGFDDEALKSSLDLITKAGGTAADQLDALAASVRGSGEAASRAAANYDPDVIAGQQSTTLYESLLNGPERTASIFGQDVSLGTVGPGFSVTQEPNAAGNILNDIVGSSLGGLIAGSDGPIDTKDLTKTIFKDALTKGDLQKRMAKALGQIGSLSDLDPETVSALASEIVGTSTQDFINAGGAPASQYDSIQANSQAIVEQWLNGLREKATGVGEVVRLTNEELTLLADNALAIGQQALSELPETAHGDRIARARQTVRAIERSIRAAGGSNPKTDQDLQQARNSLAEQRFNELEGLRQVAQQNAASQAEARQIGARFLRRELRVAVNNNDGDLLAQILGQAGKGAIAIARKMIRDAKAAVLQAREFEAKSAALVANLSGDYTKPGQTSTADSTGGLAGVLNTTPSAEDGADVYNPTAEGTGETAADRRVAAAQAAAIRRQGAIASARAEIMAAKVAMDQAKRGSVEYYSALGQLYQAQQALADAQIEYRSNLYLLGHDLTNPLTQTRAALQAAAAQLKADRGSGAGADQLAADRVAVQQAQADQESTRFSQRLEAVQTADELGRISHQRYLNYLDHEHDRLSAIKNRTYQQQEQLNQIDGLMKEAADQMAGQWNFGDIKLPTPYEVQRRVQEVYGPLGNNGPLARDPQTLDGRPNYHGGGGNNTAVYIDGADIGQIRKVLRELIGDRALTTTTASRHR